MSSTGLQAKHPAATAATARREDGALVLTIPLPSAGNALRPIAAIAAAWGLELAGLRALIARHGVQTIKCGRAVCVREADVLGILDRLPTASAAPAKASGDVAGDLAALAAKTRKAGAR